MQQLLSPGGKGKDKGQGEREKLMRCDGNSREYNSRLSVRNREGYIKKNRSPSGDWKREKTDRA